MAYKIKESDINIVSEPSIAYGHVDDANVFNIIKLAANGVSYNSFTKVVEQSSFTIKEWAAFLHISDRTMLRYSKDKKAFDMAASEIILDISMLLKLGAEVFGSVQNFTAWLSLPSMAMGGICPKELLKSRFGIEAIKNELGRIAHGIPA